ncbi:error-prone DNA polymerase [Bosea caraganae]|uniref:Error-prone DNA polymerase n=1 Tax=Bosea caraganae TaxID=2763117 RepID=A0A370L0J2_9HYPH|nr:error-prone DNA polymerase [Bosea caraganae]RDJ20773.1 error-prone DNA polymerase [Bosea caraganae]RDJ21615.1 error-prone DNA polymerase [Bosea caraganae]
MSAVNDNGRVRFALEPPPRYAELAVTSNFSFLRGASHPEELVRRAAELGLAGIGIADRNSLAGVVRAHAEMREAGIAATGLTFAVGARLVFADGTPDLLAYPQDKPAYGRLCRLLTKGKMKVEKKGECVLTLEDLREFAEGLLLILMPERRPDAEIAAALVCLAEFARGRLWLGIDMPHHGDDRRRSDRLAVLAAKARVPCLAVNDVLYHAPERRPLQDVVSCIREHVPIERAGRMLEAHAERHLKPAAEMARLFRHAPEMVVETLRFFERCRFSLDEFRYEYPDEPVPEGSTPQGHLGYLTWEGAWRRYPGGIPRKVQDLIRKELAMIARLGYARYFLTVHDIVRFARAQEPPILCQGRGSAANSAVCYCLWVTSVDPLESDLLFARFLSEERKEPPDIDVDFEHERREEVMQYVFERYGRLRAGICATVISYRPRSAIREVGKALGLSEDVTAALANTVWGSWGDGLPANHVRQAGLDPSNPMIARAVALATELIGFPRHLSQHVGGFVLTRGRLDECVPIGWGGMKDRSFIEWDKDDIDALGMMKVDVLALGMLTCIRKAFDLIEKHGGKSWELATIPQGEKPVYDMLCRAEAIGVFQVESRAQMNMLPRLKPRKFYDLVIEVAIVRPGPIQGNMVHPYLRRRNGEPVHYPSPTHGDENELKKVLEKTLGVPLFQEQAMSIAMVAAKFTDDEANGLRRAMATFRSVGTIHMFEEKMVGRMIARGYDPDFAKACFNQIKGFGDYGFPESHAASFALLVYASAWLKWFHPAAFNAALLNSQPMGFYAPAQIIRSAQEAGVEIRPADVNLSDCDNTLERREDGELAIRLGFRQIEGISKAQGLALMTARGQGYDSVEALARRSKLPVRALVALADADAFGSLGLSRREALWQVRRLPDDKPLPLFAESDSDELGEEPQTLLPLMRDSEQVVADYQHLRLSLKGHPMQFLRGLFTGERALSCGQLATGRDGQRCRLAGIITVRQRPGSAKGVMFMTLEDETGIANAVLWPKTFERYRRQAMGARLVLLEGRLQRSPEGIVHMVAEKVEDRTHELTRLSDGLLQRTLARADEVRKPGEDQRVPPRQHTHPRNVRVLPRSRDFH